MNLHTYWTSLDPIGKRDLARRCGTSVAYLSQLANGHRQAGLAMCRTLERETPVTRSVLRPDWFGVDRDGPPTAA